MARLSIAGIPAAAGILVIAAHADDEILGAGGWLGRHQGPLALAVLTEGVPPARRWFPRGRHDPAQYRQKRRSEAMRVWRHFAPRARLFFGGFADQRLHLALASAFAWLARVAEAVGPAFIVAPAFEGGHPDHDAANFLAAQLGAAIALPVWEYALYARCRGRLRRQCFPAEPGWTRPLRSRVLRTRKLQALAGYDSQRATLRYFVSGQEAVRPLPAHDYRRPPEPCLYEHWRWPIASQEVAAAMAAFLDWNIGRCAYSRLPTR